MIRILKQTPITIEGKDCLEELINDETILIGEACNYCCYREWYDVNEYGTPCNIVHGCGNGPTYFIISK